MLSKQIINKEYDSEPIKYCAKCLSLKIKYEEVTDSEYCGECGCTDIFESSVEDWEAKYQNKYGKKFVDSKKDITKHPVFQMTISQLKEKLYNSTNWKEPIMMLCPHFPKGYSKIDTILLFFDWLIRNNKVNDYRKLIINKVLQ